MALPTVFFSASLLLAASSPALASSVHKTGKTATVTPQPNDGQAEVRLMEIYRLIGQARSREALNRMESLIADYPNFQLAQLIHGDLLMAQAHRPARAMADIPDAAAQATFTELRQESQQRLKAVQERPPVGTIPSQFLALSRQNRHAIAIDASRSRLYLFENNPDGVKLVADYYVSIGKSGIEKTTSGDLRTPLGVYFISSNLDRKSLKDFYGAGALPINYPNPLDVKRGKSGSGIWLHGSPPNQFARSPYATDGCVVLANTDLERIIRMVSVRTTPVVIAPSLQWVTPHAATQLGQSFRASLQSWRNAKSSGDMSRVLDYYTVDFRNFNKTLDEWKPALRAEMGQAQGRRIELKDLSLLHWKDGAETMVVTFGEVVAGSRTGPTKRQYWVLQNQQWKIFFEGVI